MREIFSRRGDAVLRKIMNLMAVEDPGLAWIRTCSKMRSLWEKACILKNRFPVAKNRWRAGGHRVRFIGYQVRPGWTAQIAVYRCFCFFCQRDFDDYIHGQDGDESLDCQYCKRKIDFRPRDGRRPIPLENPAVRAA